MSSYTIQQLVNSLVQGLGDNEKFATPLLAAKLNKCLATYPHDQTVGSMSRVIDKMVNNNTLFVRRGDLKSLYQKFYSRGTQFGSLFQEELGQVPAEPQVTTFSRDDAAQVSEYHPGDQVLANALHSVFDRHLPVKMYSQPLADKALKSVGSTLDAWNLRPTSLTVADGNDQFIVIQANYETPKGLTSFYVPVEIHTDQVVEASVFMGNAGPQELHHANIKNYVTSLAGSKLQVDATSILQVLTKAASHHRPVSDAELALTRLTAKRQGKSEFFQNQIVGQKVAEATKLDVQLPKSDEFQTFEEQFTTVQGRVKWHFGDDKVDTGRNHIVRQLASFGFRNPQVVVTNSDQSTIFYGVSADTGKVAFTVPVKVVNGKLAKPTVMLCGGSLAPFTQEGINQLVSENRTDVKVAAAASTLSALKPSEVINNLRQAMAEGNLTKAEDALNVLANSDDTKAHAVAFQIYMNGLAGNKTAETTCKHAVKSAGKAVSEYPICSQTGLPINKVYQDKDGNCRPLYRQGMDETYEGAVFNNSKIFG